MRTAITIFITFIYCASYSWFLVYNGNMSVINLKLWINGTFGLFTFFLYLDSQYKCVEQWHIQFHKIAFLTLIINFFLIVVFYVTDGLSGLDKLLIFNGSVLALSVMILISGARHRLFNK